MNLPSSYLSWILVSSNVVVQDLLGVPQPLPEPVAPRVVNERLSPSRRVKARKRGGR
jgi:hypothetical protein